MDAILKERQFIIDELGHLKEQREATVLKLGELEQALANQKQEAIDKQNAILKEQSILENQLGAIRKLRAFENLSATEQLKQKNEELASVKTKIANAETAKAGTDDIAQKNTLTRELIALEKEQKTLTDEISKLDKKAKEESNSALEAQKKAVSSQIAQMQVDLLRVKVSGNLEAEKSLKRQIAVLREATELRSKANLSESDALKLAEQKVQYEEAAEQQKLDKAAQKKFIEAEIKGLLSEGKKIEADALSLRQRAAEYAESQKVSYEKALDAVKKIDDLQKKTPAPKETGTLGTSYAQIEKEQEKIKKLLNSKNKGTVERGRRAEQKFQDKYGIGVNDRVQDYRGRDAKGRLVDPKVGKEARENERISKEAYRKAQRAGDFNKATQTQGQPQAQTQQSGQPQPPQNGNAAPTSPSAPTPPSPPSKPSGATPPKSKSQQQAKGKDDDGAKEIVSEVEKLSSILKEAKVILEEIKNATQAIVEQISN